MEIDRSSETSGNPADLALRDSLGQRLRLINSGQMFHAPSQVEPDRRA
jgi:hypothetical protein